ncbi:hypothetical protein [Clostridium ihumii]|uniref:hypothetical protein n=1 Tax=Clostridium ihumii TaxID=1470356 RepID=UPI003D34D685
MVFIRKKLEYKNGYVMISVIILTAIIMILSTYMVGKNQTVLEYSKSNNKYLITQKEEEETKEIILSKLYNKLKNTSDEEDEDFMVEFNNSTGIYSKDSKKVTVKFLNKFKRIKIYNYNVIKEGGKIYFEN